MEPITVGRRRWAGPRSPRLRELAGFGLRTCRQALKLLSAVLFTGHFALVLVSVSPDNPVKEALAPLLRRTVDVYARQQWNLFAPDPISEDFILLAKCLDDERQIAGELTGADRESGGWHDVSDPLWKGSQAHRLSAYDRLARPFTSNVRTFLNGGAGLARWARACARHDDEEACAFYQSRLESSRERTGTTLRRLGSAYCADADPSAAGVALRARIVQPVPWSRRFESDRKVQTDDVLLGVWTTDKGVVGPGVFRAVHK